MSGEALSESAHTAAHVASEAFLVTKLAVLLLSYMGVGWRWSVRLLQMILFIALLMPAFVKVLVWYVTTDTVHRNVAYGKYVRLRGRYDVVSCICIYQVIMYFAYWYIQKHMCVYT